MSRPMRALPTVTWRAALSALPALYLGVALAAGALSGWTRAVPLAGWLAPLFLVRFLRTRRPLAGFLIAGAATGAARFVVDREAMPLPTPVALVACILGGFAGALPFLADRLTCGSGGAGRAAGTGVRRPGFATTLVLPMTAVALDYALSFAYTGTITSPAYSQAGNLPLLQLAAVTGPWGISFLLPTVSRTQSGSVRPSW